MKTRSLSHLTKFAKVLISMYKLEEKSNLWKVKCINYDEYSSIWFGTHVKSQKTRAPKSI